jgi:hypothetical protein
MAFNISSGLNQYFVDYFSVDGSKRILKSYLYHHSISNTNIKKFYIADINLSKLTTDEQFYATMIFLKYCSNTIIGISSDNEKYKVACKICVDSNIFITIKYINENGKIFLKLNIKKFLCCFSSTIIDITIPYIKSIDQIKMAQLVKSANIAIENIIDCKTKKEFNIGIRDFCNQIVLPEKQAEFVKKNKKGLQICGGFLTAYDKQNKKCSEYADNLEKLFLLCVAENSFNMVELMYD